MLAFACALGCDGKTLPAIQLSDGDQVRVVGANRGHELIMQKDGKDAVLRMVGIYTFPISVHEKPAIAGHAKASRDFAVEELKGKDVTLRLELKNTDPRGRYLGFIEVGGVDFNLTMVAQGQAALYTEYPFSREQAYTTAEDGPRKARTGMWKGDTALKRLKALRGTWKSVREGKTGKPFSDPLLK